MEDMKNKPESYWKEKLTPEQYQVCRRKGTERPFTGALYNNHASGTYECVACGQALFSSDAKFESGTGWPSFDDPINAQNVELHEDRSFFMKRVEVTCRNCGSHLGHLFDDGPRETTGMRYCLNSAALQFQPQTKKDTLGIDIEPTSQKTTVTAAFGAGCFWGVEAEFRQLKGVVSTSVGYEGGSHPRPTYHDVCTGKTGHAETVEVEYDPSRISYEDLLKVFWENHDPTTPNRQGPDFGTQYRSVIFYHTPEQQAAALASKEKLEKAGRFKRSIVTQIVPASQFHLAEDYHQQYLEKRGLSSCKLD